MPKQVGKAPEAWHPSKEPDVYSATEHPSGGWEQSGQQGRSPPAVGGRGDQKEGGALRDLISPSAAPAQPYLAVLQSASLQPGLSRGLSRGLCFWGHWGQSFVAPWPGLHGQCLTGRA